jgi:hypothetical protein
VGNKKDGSGEQDIIVNEDGTMYAAGNLSNGPGEDSEENHES